ncbi:hypothetical protein M9H77_17487 [Catharanthus roseus]|uniref:Uncharacterized protein n=1 Tax=Catharanthus roseus TaxID=4058 RepID=A0ACC0B4R0_CATRO|nr:hypothetical protein M9H77_17487 [Catharanthus roseus]
MHAKYGNPTHIISQSRPPKINDSHIWSRMLSAMNFMEQNIGVCYRSGGASFWCDNWTHSGRLSDHALGSSLLEYGDLTISDVTLADSWDSSFLYTFVPSYFIGIITTSAPFSTGTDEVLWDMEANRVIFFLSFFTPLPPHLFVFLTQNSEKSIRAISSRIEVFMYSEVTRTKKEGVKTLCIKAQKKELGIDFIKDMTRKTQTLLLSFKLSDVNRLDMQEHQGVVTRAKAKQLKSHKDQIEQENFKA